LGGSSPSLIPCSVDVFREGLENDEEEGEGDETDGGVWEEE
jgi:hypothetical protein